MKNLTAYLLLVISSLSLTSYSVANTESQISPEADIGSYQSFALLPLPTKVEGMNPGTMLKYGRNIKDGMKESLTQKGYTESPLEEADFAVSFNANSDSKIAITQLGYSYASYYNYGPWGRYPPYGGYGHWGMPMGSNVIIDEYKEGSLMVELFDNNTKELVWVGWTTLQSTGHSIRHQELTDLIIKIMRSIPKAKALDSPG